MKNKRPLHTQNYVTGLANSLGKPRGVWYSGLAFVALV